MCGKLLSILLLLCSSEIYAQMGIGTLMPDPAAQLEVKASHRGVLIPRLPLTDLYDQNTITAGNVESLLIYNTTLSSDLKPGYYYWYQDRWRRLMNPSDLPENSVFWDVSDGQFYYLDQNGVRQNVNVGVGNETLTILSLNPDGHTLVYKDENSNTHYIDLRTVVQNNQQTMSLTDGVNTTVSSVLMGNNTNYRVNVDTAQGTQLGVVREANGNPSITINSSGELELNLTAVNAVKVISQDYTALWSDRIILGETTGGDITVTLPNPAHHKGKMYTIRKNNQNETYYLFVSGQIDGISSGQQLYTALPYTGWRLVSDGVKWHIIDKF